jgi:hypothetical protein
MRKPSRTVRERVAAEMREDRERMEQQAMREHMEALDGREGRSALCAPPASTNNRKAAQ